MRPQRTATLADEVSIVPAEKNEVKETGVKPDESGSNDHPGIASMFTRSETKKILKSIFHKDKDEFGSTLRALDRAGSWEEASLMLDDLFLARDVSPQSTAAMLLTEKTYERYNTMKH